jgi:hypothetical protein
MTARVLIIMVTEGQNKYRLPNHREEAVVKANKKAPDPLLSARQKWDGGVVLEMEVEAEAQNLVEEAAVVPNVEDPLPQKHHEDVAVITITRARKFQNLHVEVAARRDKIDRDPLMEVGGNLRGERAWMIVALRNIVSNPKLLNRDNRGD